MKTFALSSAAQQSLLMVFLFLTLVLSLFLLIIVFGNYHDRRKRYLNVSVFAVLFVLLIILADAFVQTSHGYTPVISNHVPILLLWCIVGSIDLLLLWEMTGLYRTKGQKLNRNSIKEAMDQLPSGICYFTMSGTVKLCNLQMYRLFHSLAQKDLQTLSELEEALDGCGSDTGVICLSKELQNYLFPDGRVWRYRKSQVKDKAGTQYTEVVFSDLTEQYVREQELKTQTKELKEISRQLKRLSDNALILAREKEVLAAKTKLHNRMGAGLTAVRQILLHHGTSEIENAVKLLRQAVSAVKNDNEYPAEKDELAKFMQDAETVGVKVNLSGKLPKCEDISFVYLIAMRECLSNGVRHAGATELWIEMQEDDSFVSIHITNDGTPPESEVVPKGGLHNLYSYVLDFGGKMKIQSKPSFALTVTLPKAKEEKT
ncbi:MAG: ATP-binding protein [Monoglobaceae bacterium]